MAVPDGLHQCPCCDYYTLQRRAAHDICPVCYWEDDGQDLGELDRVSSPNHLSLRQARQNFASYGASDQAAVSLVAPEMEREGLRRELRATYG
jgi:Cysteine-rich CPCC